MARFVHLNIARHPFPEVHCNHIKQGHIWVYRNGTQIHFSWKPFVVLKMLSSKVYHYSGVRTIVIYDVK